jgi:hypothetical protein
METKNGNEPVPRVDPCVRLTRAHSFSRAPGRACRRGFAPPSSSPPLFTSLDRCGDRSRVESEHATLEIRARFSVTAPFRSLQKHARRKHRCDPRRRRARPISAAQAVRLCPRRPT